MKKKDRLVQWDEVEKQDQNRNGLDDRVEPPVPDVSAGTAKLSERLREHPNASPVLSGGDVDARWEADAEGDEHVAGSTATPGQNVVEEIGRAIGVTYQDGEELRAGEKERSRDRNRWELDPASAEDYKDRTRDGD